MTQRINTLEERIKSLSKAPPQIMASVSSAGLDATIVSLEEQMTNIRRELVESNTQLQRELGELNTRLAQESLMDTHGAPPPAYGR